MAICFLENPQSQTGASKFNLSTVYLYFQYCNLKCRHCWINPPYSDEVSVKKDEIPLGSRILAVADAFDAMNSERAYRKPLSREDIISEFNKSRGTQHSPEIIDIFLKALGKNPALWNR